MRSEYSSIVCHRCRQSGAANPWSSLSTTAGTLAGCAPTADINKARATRAPHSGRWSARAIPRIVRRRSARVESQPQGGALMTGKSLLALVAVVALVGAGIGTASAGVEKLYVLDCGQNLGKDQSRWSPGVNKGKPIEFSDNCYLIRHDRGLLLWDTGIPDSVAAMP